MGYFGTVSTDAQPTVQVAPRTVRAEGPDPERRPAASLDDRDRFAVDLAHTAGSYLLDRFGERITTTAKPDGTPVSEVDRGCERMLRDAIALRYPADGVLGEEFGETPGASGGRWILDPIDGTQSFVRGVPLFGVLIGYECAGVVECGVVFMPALGELVWAVRGGGAWRSYQEGRPLPVRVSTTARIAEALLLTTSPDYFRLASAPGLYGRLASAAGGNRGWSDCYAPLLVATGRADACVEPVMYPYDSAPFRVILPEAGGRCTDWAGGEDIDASTCVYSNGALHGELLALLDEPEARRVVAMRAGIRS